MDRTQKESIVGELKKELVGVQSIVLADTRGIDVPTVTAVRDAFRAAGCRYQVVKNTMVRIAVEGTAASAMVKLLAGPTAVIWSCESPTAPAKVRRLGPTELELTIHEGRNRQVKRMLEAVGHRVVELRRVSFGSLELGTLREGAARKLKAAEVDALRRLAEAGPSRSTPR